MGLRCNVDVDVGLSEGVDVENTRWGRQKSGQRGGGLQMTLQMFCNQMRDGLQRGDIGRRTSHVGYSFVYPCWSPETKIPISSLMISIPICMPSPCTAQKLRCRIERS